jgi:F0F1-type ATP synthase delta subunit
MIKGNVYIAGPFDDTEIRKIEAHFTEMLGDQVVLNVRKDDKLIGGFWLPWTARSMMPAS